MVHCFYVCCLIFICYGYFKLLNCYLTKVKFVFLLKAFEAFVCPRRLQFGPPIENLTKLPLWKQFFYFFPNIINCQKSQTTFKVPLILKC